MAYFEVLVAICCIGLCVLAVASFLAIIATLVICVIDFAKSHNGW